MVKQKKVGLIGMYLNSINTRKVKPKSQKKNPKKEKITKEQKANLESLRGKKKQISKALSKGSIRVTKEGVKLR